MKHWYIYNLQSGLFTGGYLALANESRLAQNLPEGHGALEVIGRGVIDHLSQRYDIPTKLVVDYTPPQPSEDHEWNADVKRWALAPDILEAQSKHVTALSAIEDEERRSFRSLREAMIGTAINDPEGLKKSVLRLRESDERIAVLRKDLAK